MYAIWCSIYIAINLSWKASLGGNRSVHYLLYVQSVEFNVVFVDGAYITACNTVCFKVENLTAVHPYYLVIIRYICLCMREKPL